MNIAVIGTGRVGSTLGKLWGAGGHTVVYGSRTPDDPRVRELVEQTGSGASAASGNEAARSAEVVLLAVPGRVAAQTTRSLGDLSGKVLLDATNPMGEGLEGAASGAERLAREAPGARVVKAFNTTGTGNMQEPGYSDGAASMFVCGDDDEAREIAAGLAAEVGLDPVDCGPLSAAGLLEAMGQLWVHLAYRRELGPDIAYRLMRR